MTYEDIAKLNPFYEEYNTFWDAEPEPAATFSSSASSKSYASSYYSGSEFSFPRERSSSPHPHKVQSQGGFRLPESPHPAVHDVGKHQPRVETPEVCRGSHIAFVEDEDDYGRYSAFESQAKLPESDLFGFSTFHQKGLPRKKLFGENGWLGSTADMTQPAEKTKSKIFKDFGKKIKQHVEDMVSFCRSIRRSCVRDSNRASQAVDMVRAHPVQLGHQGQGPSRSSIVEKSSITIPISLDRLAQSKLYSEMEFMICVSANHFLVEQYKDGRISEESIRKVSNYWASKNRPQVVEFQFDQATQRQLILANLRTLSFNGESSANAVLLQSNLQNWKAIVKEMSIRTFCLPDSAVRKHMHDIHKLLDMLGAPVATFFAFQELQMDTLSLMQRELRRSQYPQRHDSLSSTTRRLADLGMI